MSDLFFLIILLSKISCVISFFTVLLWLGFLISAIIFICGWCKKSANSGYGEGDRDYDKGNALRDKVFKPTVVLFILLILFQSICIFFPTKKEILTYYIIKQVDDYNVEYTDSNFNPENFIKNIDSSINKISDLTDRLIDRVEKKEVSE